MTKRSILCFAFGLLPGMLKQSIASKPRNQYMQNPVLKSILSCHRTAAGSPDRFAGKSQQSVNS
jgi:hypothetical protein